MLGHKLYQSIQSPLDAWVTVRGDARKVARYGLFCPDRVIGEVNANDLESVQRAIEIVQPEVVVNCIGIVKQQPLGNDPIACLTINALFPHRLANLCSVSDSRLIHISTDCVFDGAKGNYTEDDTTNAVDLYGRSKAMGETVAPNALTIRTSIIGRELGSSFGLVEWFLSQRGGNAKGFTEAKFSGLTTHHLSQVIQSVICDYQGLTGIYQVSSAPIDKLSLLELLNSAFKAEVEITPSGDVKIDRTLDCTRFQRETGYKLPNWTEMIGEMADSSMSYEFWRSRK